MTTQTMQAAACKRASRGETMKDILMVSSFGFWAVMLGLAPVLAFSMLMGS